MRRFKNILLVCDEHGAHDDTIDRALILAKKNDAQVTVAGVIDAAPGELARLYGALPGARAHDIESEVIEFHRARLAQLAAPLRAAGITTTEILLQGIPFVEIIRKVVADGHDLVIKGAAGEFEGRSLVFASTDLHLLRKCPSPVWLIKHGARRRSARILAAVEPDPRDKKRDQLNTLIMELATSLSLLEDSELHMTHVWNLEGEDTLRQRGFARVSKAEVDLLVEARRRRSEEMLQELSSRFPNGQERRQVHLLKGTAGEAIPRLAAEKQVDLIVMGTVGRTGISGLIIGNTAEAILNQVDCSVLAVKPTGFETPVRLDARSIDSLPMLRSA